MGLTIHYELSLSRDEAAGDLDDLRASWAVESARALALKMKRRGAFERVTPLRRDAPALASAMEWRSLPVRGEPNLFHGVEIRPVAGELFHVDVGRDCEPLCIGLCRYPASVRVMGREVRARRGPVWRMDGFTKTQYASLHGWEHFFRCHSAVIEFLAALRDAGFRVKISDEGSYWPRRSASVLRRELDKMNGLVAGLAGALKDTADEIDGSAKIESPILRHRNFERLEADGESQNGAAIRAAARMISGSRAENH